MMTLGSKQRFGLLLVCCMALVGSRATSTVDPLGPPLTAEQVHALSHPRSSKDPQLHTKPHIGLNANEQTIVLEPLVQGLAETIQRLTHAYHDRFATELHKREKQLAHGHPRKQGQSDAQASHASPKGMHAQAQLTEKVDQLAQLIHSGMSLDSPHAHQLLSQLVAAAHIDDAHGLQQQHHEREHQHQHQQPQHESWPSGSHSQSHPHYGPPPNLMALPTGAALDQHTSGAKGHVGQDHLTLHPDLVHAQQAAVHAFGSPHSAHLSGVWQQIARNVSEMNEHLVLSYRHRSADEMKKNPHVTLDGHECRGQGDVEVMVNDKREHCRFVYSDKLQIVLQRFPKVSYLKNVDSSKKGCLADLTNHYLVNVDGYHELEPIQARFNGDFKKMIITDGSDQYVWEFNDVLAYFHLFNVGDFKLTLENRLGTPIVIKRQHRHSRVHIASCPPIHVQGITSDVLKYVALNVAENTLTAAYDIDDSQTCVTSLSPEVAHLLKIFNKEGKIHLAVTHSATQRVPSLPTWTTLERQTDAGLMKLAWRPLSQVELQDLEHIDNEGRNCYGAGQFEVVINHNPRRAFVTDKDRLALILRAFNQAPFLVSDPLVAPISGILYDHGNHLIIDAKSVYYYHQVRVVFDDDPESALVQFKKRKYRWKPNAVELPLGNSLYEHLLDEKSGAVKLTFKSSNPLEKSFVIEQDYDGDIHLRGGDKISDFDHDESSNAITQVHLNVTANKVVGKYMRNLSQSASVSLTQPAVALLKYLITKTCLPIKIDA